MVVWLVEDGAHQVRLFRAPIWCPSGGGGTREAGGTVVESLLMVGRSRTRKRTVARSIGRVSTRLSTRAEGCSIVDEPGKC